MTQSQEDPSTPARIEYLKVRNFRALREVELKALTPLTVLLGPNGSGKSTVFDREGQGRAVSGELPDEEDKRVDIPLKSARRSG